MIVVVFTLYALALIVTMFLKLLSSCVKRRNVVKGGTEEIDIEEKAVVHKHCHSCFKRNSNNCRVGYSAQANAME